MTRNPVFWLSTVCLLFASSFMVYSQVRKQYSGPYDGGEATYQFFEDDNSERVLDGPFSYSNRNKRDPNSSETVKAVGAFVNNKKEGAWKFTYLVMSNAYPNNGYCNDIIVINYSAGKRNGSASYSRVLQSSGKVIIKSTASFKNNLQVGDFTYVESTQNKTINAHLDEDGYFDGPCTIKFTNGTKSYTDLIIYKSGILVSRLFKDIVEGDVIVNVKSNDLASEFINNFNPSSASATISSISLDDRYPIFNFHTGNCLYKSDLPRYGYGKKQGDSSDGKGEIYAYDNLTLRFVRKEICLPTRSGFPKSLSNELGFWQFACPCETQPTRNITSKYTQGVEPFEFLPVRDIVVFHPGVDD